MKSVITTLLFAAIGVLIILIVSLVLMSSAQKAYEEKSLEALKRFKTYRPYIFDINDLLVDPNDPTVWSANDQNRYYGLGHIPIQDPQFCKDIRRCIENNFEEGQSHCLLSYKVEHGVTFYSSYILDSITSRCPTIDVMEEIGGIGRKICSFDSNSIERYNKFKENNISLIDYQPYIHNCYIPPELGTGNILPDKTDQINYLYSGRGTEDGYYFKNGGTVRIIVTNFSVKDDPVGTCSYSLHVCGQNAIAASEDETPVEIFKTIQSLGEKGLEKGENELYYNETIYWGGPTPKLPGDIEIETIGAFFDPVLWLIYQLNYLSNLPKPPSINNIYGYHPRTNEFIFSGTYPNKEALVDAVDAGMWEWSEKHYTNKESMKYFMHLEPEFKNIYFSYLPIDNILEDSSKINFDQGCWNSDYESSNAYDRLKMNADTFEDSDNLKHNFNFSSFNFNVGDTIRMNLGIKKFFITLKEWKIKVKFLGIEVWSQTFSLINSINDKYEDIGVYLKPRVIMVMDPVTFCPRPATCGNGVCDWAVGECDNCPSECSLADCCTSIGGNDPNCNSAVGENSGNCLKPPGDCIHITCPDDTCDVGENCPDDASACPDNMCYEPTCTNGCGEYAVGAGGQDEACYGTTGCSTPPCRCDGSGNCTSGGSPGPGPAVSTLPDPPDLWTENNPVQDICWSGACVNITDGYWNNQWSNPVYLENTDVISGSYSIRNVFRTSSGATTNGILFLSVEADGFTEIPFDLTGYSQVHFWIKLVNTYSPADLGFDNCHINLWDSDGNRDWEPAYLRFSTITAHTGVWEEITLNLADVTADPVNFDWTLVTGVEVECSTGTDGSLMYIDDLYFIL